MVRIYSLKTCDSCRKAKKFLKTHDIEFEEIAIRDQPPSLDELNTALQQLNGDLRKLFNTSGKDYRDLNLKEKIPTMSPDEALALLASNGNLIKRPFLKSGENYFVGFVENTYEKAFLH